MSHQVDETAIRQAFENLTDAIRKLTPARGFDIPNVATLKPKKKRA